MKIGGIAQLVRRLVQRLLLQAIALLLARLALLLAGGALLIGEVVVPGRAFGGRFRIADDGRQVAFLIGLQSVEQMSALLRGRTHLVRGRTHPVRSRRPTRS